MEKMDNIVRNDYKKAFAEDVMDFVKNKPDNWRDGQAAFNYIDGKYHVAREVQFEDKVDCFYDDGKIDEFIDKSFDRLSPEYEKLWEAQAAAYSAPPFLIDNLSDGCHTFKELYGYRSAYNAMLFNEFHRQGLYNVHKSWRHSDGSYCYGGGWFVVQATLPTGQVSNHYPSCEWNKFTCEERDNADEWDGHDSAEALRRMNEFIIENAKKTTSA